MIGRGMETVIKPLKDPSRGLLHKSKTLDKKALLKACQQFEALFIHQMMKDMRKTVQEGELLHGGNGEKIFMDMRDQAMSDELAEAGGLGLAKMIYRQLLDPGDREPLGRTNRTIQSYQRNNAPETAGVAAETAPADQDAFTMPVAGRLTSGFGMRVHPILNQEMMHRGVDLAAPEGTAIKAAADGRVSFSGWSGGYGNLVEVDHGNGLISRYGHNSENLVEVGDTVKAGQLVGRVGSTGRSTGPHLHFEVRKDGLAVDPYTMLNKENRLADKSSAKDKVSG